MKNLKGKISPLSAYREIEIADWKTAVKHDKLPWLNLIDTNGRESLVQFKYGITMLPTNFLIGPDGKILAKDITPEELEALLIKNQRQIADNKG